MYNCVQMTGTLSSKFEPEKKRDVPTNKRKSGTKLSTMSAFCARGKLVELGAAIARFEGVFYSLPGNLRTRFEPSLQTIREDFQSVKESVARIDAAILNYAVSVNQTKAASYHLSPESLHHVRNADADDTKERIVRHLQAHVDAVEAEMMKAHDNAMQAEMMKAVLLNVVARCAGTPGNTV